MQYFVKDFNENRCSMKEAALDLTLYFLREMKQDEAADTLEGKRLCSLIPAMSICFLFHDHCYDSEEDHLLFICLSYYVFITCSVSSSDRLPHSVLYIINPETKQSFISVFR